MKISEWLKQDVEARRGHDFPLLIGQTLYDQWKATGVDMSMFAVHERIPLTDGDTKSMWVRT